MNLQSAQYLSNSKQIPHVYSAELGWNEIRKGLGGILLGYFVLLFGTLLGAGLHFMALHGHGFARWAKYKGEPWDLFFPLTVGAFSLTVLLGTILIFRGQWRCLKHAPSVQNGKELIYACFNCVAGSVILGAAGVYQAGTKTYAAFATGADWMDALDFTNPGSLMQMGSVVLAVLSCVIFTQYLGSVALAIQNQGRAVSVERNLLFIGLLVGATIGTLMCYNRLAIVNALLPWVGVCWIVWFVWHVWLVWTLRWAVGKTAGRYSGLRKPVKPVDGGAVGTKSLSGLRRMANREPQI
jgi:hypothetical protein